ncbi:hypothetical protein [Niabella ginsengisoli]|uniref:Uncharacterized protein n=1 Tax=Niabella ginsengisoli TaxID=522298 RepID=A0ABS9SGR2_9BACT|nr:hypothetical protein [Niabella ginsengisoli]MCH5597558.1 hypothetical protein [Niabella ginsengisoli]
MESNNHDNGIRTATSETFSNIQQNRTLIAGKFTVEAPLKPQAVHGLQNMNQLFEYYKPEISVELESANRGISKEILKFKNLTDFDLTNIISQSSVLKNIATKKKAI